MSKVGFLFSVLSSLILYLTLLQLRRKATFNMLPIFKEKYIYVFCSQNISF